ncbi:uncharacterized protein LOC132619966 [Lycium barbarum]|uniref:uncharacterized protein LOC132619966 n=1 Tax=Lycium barbarum TaxID=112863 RepID=UPI00293EBA54|nr:uncharacterized protein LOC132619966 [Lycium barbarum]
MLCAVPTLEEVKKAIFELSGDSASGPDGLNGVFYHSYWEIVSADEYSVVKAFWDGHTLPKAITHTNLVLLPKKNEVETFLDMRPISLSNYINKILSREIVSDIRLRGKPANVVIKLNMTKAYNRVLWLFLTKAYGFFCSSRGAKQDDTIIFSSADGYSLKQIMETLQNYESVSGQLINKNKILSTCSIRKMKANYSELLKKVRDKLNAWKGKLLSPGGKAVLISSVLQSILIHLLSALKPPIRVIKELHKIFNKLFWSNKEDGRYRNWWKGGSQNWKMMLDARDNIEQEIWWEIRSGTANVWYDNWTKIGALYYVLNEIDESVEDVKELMLDGG